MSGASAPFSFSASSILLRESHPPYKQIKDPFLCRSTCVHTGIVINPKCPPFLLPFATLLLGFPWERHALGHELQPLRTSRPQLSPALLPDTQSPSGSR